MSEIKAETAERLGTLVEEFTGSIPSYYRKTFAYMMQAPGFRFTLNYAAGLLVPIWFGARGMWSWCSGFLLLELSPTSKPAKA